MSKKSKMALNTRPIVSGIMESIQAMIMSSNIGQNAICANVSAFGAVSSSKNPANTHQMNAYIMIPIIIFISSHLLSSVKVQFNISALFHILGNALVSFLHNHHFLLLHSHRTGTQCCHQHHLLDYVRSCHL